MGVLTSPFIRFAAALFALIAALLAQRATSTAPYALAGWGLYAGAAILFALATWQRVDADETAAAAPPDVPPPSAPLPRLAAALAAFLALAVAIGFSETEKYPWTSFGFWIVALAAMTIALRDWQIAPSRRRSPAWTAREFATLVIITLFAAAARFSWLDAIPYHVIGDEPRVAAQIFRYNRDELRSLFHMGWNTWPNMGMVLQGLFTPFFGIHTTTLKMSSALVGSLAVASTYVLARELLSRRVAIFTAVLFAICRTAIDFSRLGVCHAQVMLWGSLAFALWFRALNTGKATTYLWSGVSAGLCLYSYNAGQSFPPMLFSWIAISAVFRLRAIRTHWKAVVAVGIGFFLCASPLVYHITDHFQFLHNWVEWTHMARNRQVVNQITEVWNTQGWEAAKPLVYRQVFGTALGFTAIPAGAYGIGYRGGGLLDHVSSALFILGLGSLLTHVFRREAILLYWFFVSAFIGSVLTDDPPATVRMVGLVPTLPIIAAIALAALVELSEKAKALRLVGVAVATMLLAGAAFDTWRTYFVEYAASEPDGATDLARRFDHLPKDYVGRLLGAEYYMRFGDELFYINFFGRDLVNVEEPAHFLPVHTKTEHPLAVVLTPPQIDLMPYLQTLYPKADLFEFYSNADQRVSYRMATLTPEQLLERTGLTRKIGNNAARTDDPFVPAAEDSQEPIEWSGRIYWPTDHPATLHIQSTPGGQFTLGDKLRRKLEPAERVQEKLELPIGWTPVSLVQPAGRGGKLSLRIEYDGQLIEVDRWSLRPDSTLEGLRAVYSRDGVPILRRTDPLLDTFAIENFWEAPREQMVVRAPFDVDWSANLRVPTTGTYTFITQTSGPYVVEIDGKALCQSDTVLPENPQTCPGTRELTQGNHALKVRWSCIATPNSNRRLFQLFWVPPGGKRELIPPTQFEPTASS